jgi:tetratricopeptide (TPR) repeat protein
MSQKPNDALMEFDKAIEADPDYIMAYKNRGATYLSLNKYRDSIKDYDRFVELDPDNAEAYYGRGMAYLMNKDEEKGCADFKKACDLGNCSGVAFAQMSGKCGMEGQLDDMMNKAMQDAQKQAEQMMKQQGK